MPKSMLIHDFDELTPDEIRNFMRDTDDKIISIRAQIDNLQKEIVALEHSKMSAFLNVFFRLKKGEIYE